jgi:hypothetical protein
MDSAIISDSPPTGRKLSNFGDIRKGDFRIGVAGESKCLDLAIGEILRIPFMTAERTGSQVKHVDMALRHRVRRPAVPFRMVMVELNAITRRVPTSVQRQRNPLIQNSSPTLKSDKRIPCSRIAAILSSLKCSI